MTEINRSLGTPATASEALPAGATGLVGWLDRTWTAIVAMSAKLPASLGTKTAATSLSVTVATLAYLSRIDVTRPADTTTYTAGDVVGGPITFAGMGLPGAHVFLTCADLRINVAAIPSGMTSFRLHLYDVTPPSALAAVQFILKGGLNA